MNKNNTKKAYFGAGCFWGVEDAFKKNKGVIKTTVGYMGGDVPEPTYEQVCTNETGHAETVEVTYNPEQISYDGLLDKFWEIHDPTQLNRQGPDVGTQYRSTIFYLNDKQKEKAQTSKERMEKKEKYKDKIVTEIVPANKFYKAEEYHQNYYGKNK